MKIIIIVAVVLYLLWPSITDPTEKGANNSTTRTTGVFGWVVQKWAEDLPSTLVMDGFSKLVNGK